MIKFGIVGPGGIARVHARAIKEIREARLVGVYGHREESVRKFAKEFGISWHTDFDEFLHNIDALSVCTPHNVRSELILPAAAAGKHVLVEKPLAITLEEADRIISACEENHVKLGVVFQSRFADDVQSVKKALSGSLLGKLIFISGYVKWYRKPEYYSRWHGKWSTEGGGVLINQAIHVIDLVRWLGGEVTDVVAFTDHLFQKIEVEDIAIVMLRFSSGALGSIEASTATYPGYPMRLEIHTTLGTLKIEENELVAVDLKDPRLAESLFPHVGKRSFFSGSSNPLAIDVLPHKRQISDFVDAILNDRSPSINGLEGRKALEIVIKAYESARSYKIGGLHENT